MGGGDRITDRAWLTPFARAIPIIILGVIVALFTPTFTPTAIADRPEGIVAGAHIGTTAEPALSDNGPSFGVSIHGPVPGRRHQRLDWLPWTPALGLTASLSRIHREDDALTLATLGPMLRWSLHNSDTTIRLSLRPGLISRSTLGDQELGGRFQFTSGVTVSQAISELWRLAISAQHTSNARLYENNDGFNLGTISLEHAF